ncbi:MAG: YeeE/YedE thiosulfate transporter family protein [Rubricoccaceae bacterium]|nr:YeeE/YedE thiosulfate transporter family protein [Rubricoccaceae bacterium]
MPTDSILQTDAPPPPAAEPLECTDTEQVPAPLKAKALREGNAPAALLGYLALGALFGVVLVESQVVSWFRIQEMFRFDAFHLYGVIGSAVATAALSLWAIRRLGLTTLHGEPIVVAPKRWGGGRVPGARYWMGGTLFGLGWALVGACPGPLFALVGGGYGVMLVALAAALAGTWAYAALQPRLPH